MLCTCEIDLSFTNHQKLARNYDGGGYRAGHLLDSVRAHWSQQNSNRQACSDTVCGHIFTDVFRIGNLFQVENAVELLFVSAAYTNRAANSS
mmetsp:Transcript_30347/g.48324  ORF Transcript_30347/g.48324 Transcript_30347/m.48324 type:complete len:92 (-) Transcript_30347:184-459(-)